jgi:hypothetical protein
LVSASGIANELEPLQARVLKVNGWIGEQVIAFTPYQPPAPAA